MAFLAAVVGVLRLRSTPARLVPAIEPWRPLLASVASSPVVSWRSIPDAAALAPTYFNASPSSLTPPWATPAPAARVSATLAAVAPEEAKTVICAAMMLVACARSMLSAAASASDALSSPPTTSEALRPARISSLAAAAESRALYPKAAPDVSAASRSLVKFCTVSSVLPYIAACTFDISLLNSILALVAMPSPSTAAPPTMARPLATPSKSPCAARCAALSLAVAVVAFSASEA